MTAVAAGGGGAAEARSTSRTSNSRSSNSVEDMRTTRRFEPAHLPEVLARAARALQKPRTLDGMLSAIAETACTTIPGIDHAGLCVVDGDGTPETRGATHDVVRTLGDIQLAAGEGPAVSSLASDEVVEVHTVAHEQRWPRYIPLATEAGVRSQLAVRLHSSRRGSCSLVLCSTTSDAIHPEAPRTTALYAVHAAGALAAARREAQLRDGMASRTTIGIAIGLLMERYDLTEDRSFRFLVRKSQESNVKVRHVAEELVREAEGRAA